MSMRVSNDALFVRRRGTAAIGILVGGMALGNVNAANTPLTDSTFSTAITSCLAEDEAGGICPTYGASSGFGEMPDWDVT